MVAPVFVADLATLKQQLRLTGIDASADSEQILDLGILEVRTKFNARLGIARVAELVAFGPLVAAPATNDELLYAIAAATETKWIRLELSCTLPWVWQDSNGGAGKSYNEDGLFREKGEATFDQLRMKAQKQIDTAMDILAGDVALGESGGHVRAFDGKPDCVAQAIGESLGYFLGTLIHQHHLGHPAGFLE